jgi:hypothetical protein
VCGAVCTAAYTSGTVVTLAAAPVAGSRFAGWSGGECSGSGACTVTVRADTSVTAVFTQDAQVLTVSVGGSGAGTVTSTSPPGISCGAACSAAFGHGTAVTLVATPAPGSSFALWSGGGCSGTGPCTVSMTAATRVSAWFRLDWYYLTVSRAGTGAGRIVATPVRVIDCGSLCSFPSLYGGTLVLEAIPAEGSVFAGWSGACTGSGSCVVRITESRSVIGIFLRQPSGP